MPNLGLRAPDWAGGFLPGLGFHGLFARASSRTKFQFGHRTSRQSGVGVPVRAPRSPSFASQAQESQFAFDNRPEVARRAHRKTVTNCKVAEVEHRRP